MVGIPRTKVVTELSRKAVFNVLATLVSACIIGIFTQILISYNTLRSVRQTVEVLSGDVLELKRDVKIILFSKAGMTTTLPLETR